MIIDHAILADDPAPALDPGRRAPVEPAPEAPVEARAAFVLRLAEALHRFGVPAHRLEAAVLTASERLEVRASCFATPTGLMTSFEPEAADPGDAPPGPRMGVVRAEAGPIDLGRIVEAERILAALSPDPATLADARARLEGVIVRPDRPGPWITAPCLALACAGAGRLFGLPALGLVAAGLGGLVVFALLALGATRPRLGGVVVLLAATLVSAGAELAARATGLSAFPVALAGLILLVPGLSFTLAMSELSARHLVSGTARITGALVDFLALGFGLALGTRAAGAAWDLLPAELGTPWPMPPALLAAPAPWTLWLAVVLAPCTFTVLFRAPLRAMPFVVAASAAAFAAADAVAGLAASPALGGLAGATTAGLLGNALSRGLAMPSAVVMVPGIMLLVPGGVGMQALDALMARDVVSGLDDAVEALLTGSALATGLLLASALLPPGRPL